MVCYLENVYDDNIFLYHQMLQLVYWRYNVVKLVHLKQLFRRFPPSYD